MARQMRHTMFLAPCELHPNARASPHENNANRAAKDVTQIGTNSVRFLSGHAGMSDPVLIESDPRGVWTITLNRPKARNALRTDMIEGIEAGLAKAATCGRVVVLQGAGGHFCAGGDIKEMASARTKQAGPGEDPIADLNARFGDVALAITEFPLPVIAITQGAVLGGGFGLATAADIVLAEEGSRFGLPETSLGILPAQIAPFLIRRLGLSTSRRLALTGAKIDAHEALRIGLVDLVSPAHSLGARLEAILEKILRCAPGATSATKRLFSDLATPIESATIQDAAKRFATLARGEEAQEGMMAFIQKRSPNWTTTQNED